MSYLLSKAVLKAAITPTVRWKLRKMFPGAFFFPHMKHDEYLLFKELCSSKKVFLEYGSGGSTIYFLKKNKDVFSVESNPGFYSFMKSIQMVKDSLDKKLHYRFIDLGATDVWGKPLTNDNNSYWAEYYSRIWKDINPATDKVDVIFIDGRFRICCCLYSILKLVEYNWKDTVLIIHDFWRRKKYHVVLEFLEEIKSASDLASFRIKENIDIEEVKKKIQEYALVIS
jgi:hypothetical protein